MRPRRDLIPHAHHCVVCAGGAPTASGFKAQPKHKCSGSHLAVQSGALATPTGLEPATSAVTGRRANPLRYGASVVLRGRRIVRRALSAATATLTHRP